MLLPITSSWPEVEVPGYFFFLSLHTQSVYGKLREAAEIP